MDGHGPPEKAPRSPVAESARPRNRRAHSRSSAIRTRPDAERQWSGSESRPNALGAPGPRVEAFPRAMRMFRERSRMFVSCLALRADGSPPQPLDKALEPPGEAGIRPRRRRQEAERAAAGSSRPFIRSERGGNCGGDHETAAAAPPRPARRTRFPEPTWPGKPCGSRSKVCAMPGTTGRIAPPPFAGRLASGERAQRVQRVRRSRHGRPWTRRRRRCAQEGA